MVSVDTNIVVRLLTSDDRIQAGNAIRLFEKHSIYITKSVVLETEWVLRGVYNLERTVVNSSLKALVSLENVVVEDEAVVFAALDHHNLGVDFADALHLASSQRAERFASFDKALCARTKKLEIQPPVFVPDHKNTIV